LNGPLPRGLTQAGDSFDGEDLQFALQVARGAAE
jgi:hypothetical protein